MVVVIDFLLDPSVAQGGCVHHVSCDGECNSGCHKTKSLHFFSPLFGYWNSGCIYLPYAGEK
jgi:hypothetical protein